MIAVILTLIVTHADTHRMQGDWLMIERHHSNGTVTNYPNGEQSINHFNIYIKGNTATIHHDWTDPDDTVENTFTISGPNRIDLVVAGTTIGGLKKGEKQAALYKFDGDTLVICEGTYGEKRPTEFKAAEGVYLDKFMRAKKQ